MEEYKGLQGRQAWAAKRQDALNEQAMMADFLRRQEEAATPPEPAPVVNTPAVASPNQGSMAPPSASMPNGGVPTGTTAADPTSYWSTKAPQLQVGVTDPADPIQYDYSHLQQQALQSAAEKFSGSTADSRALRAGVGSNYSRGGQNG